MKLLKLRNIAIAGALGIAGMGLIGVGAHATFDAAATSSQVISTGAPAITLEGSCFAGPCMNNPVLDTITNNNSNAPTLSFTAGGPYGSSFTTGDELVTGTNTGNIPLSELTITLNSTYPTSALAEGASVCVASTGIGTDHVHPFVVYNGPLSPGGVVAGPFGPFNIPLPTSASDNWIVDVFAGTQTTACGSTTGGGTAPASTGPSVSSPLGSGAENQSIVVSLTMSFSG